MASENRDYFMVGECVRFLFTSCEGSLNERVSAANELSLPRRLLFFKKPRKRGKGGKSGKAENRERRKKRETGKSEESLCQISVEIWRPPGGGGLCTAMPACWAVEQRILKMAFLNFNNPNK